MPQLNPEFFITQLFWLVVTFSFLLIFLWRISLPRIGSVLEKREKKINDDIAAAKRLQDDAEKIQKEIEEKLREVKNNNADLIKTTLLSLQEKTNEKLETLDNELNTKIEDSFISIEKNKDESMKQIEGQIIEITKLTLSKISNIQINMDEVKEVLPSLQKKVN